MKKNFPPNWSLVVLAAIALPPVVFMLLMSWKWFVNWLVACPCQ